MQTRFLLATVSCLFLFSFELSAQEGGPPAMPSGGFAQIRQTPRMLEGMKTGMKTGIRSFWNGRGASFMVVPLLNEPEVREAWAVSDEQHQQIQDIQRTTMFGMQNHPEFQDLTAEMRAIQTPGDPFLQNADAETRKKFQDIQERMGTLAINLTADAVEGLLTPEQQRKMKELQLSNMSEMPVISPNMFEALDLTDAQKQQMEGIKKELEPEFERNLEEFANGQVIIMSKMLGELEKQGGDFTNVRGMQEKMQAIAKKLTAEDPEFKRIQEDLLTKGKLFVTQFKTKMFDVLTDEQWARLQELTDNPPEYVLSLRKKMRERMGIGGEQAGAWQPGTDSWKPGEAIPEEYRQNRPARGFPRSDNTEP